VPAKHGIFRNKFTSPIDSVEIKASEDWVEFQATAVSRASWRHAFKNIVIAQARFRDEDERAPVSLTTTSSVVRENQWRQHVTSNYMRRVDIWHTNNLVVAGRDLPKVLIRPPKWKRSRVQTIPITEVNHHFFLGQRTSKQQAKLIQQRKARRVRISIG